MRGRESFEAFVVLIVGAALIAGFQVVALGRKMIDAALGFALGVVVSVLIAGIIDCASTDKGPRDGDDR
jgi:hypothetical protein